MYILYRSRCILHTQREMTSIHPTSFSPYSRSRRRPLPVGVVDCILLPLLSPPSLPFSLTGCLYSVMLFCLHASLVVSSCWYRSQWNGARSDGESDGEDLLDHHENKRRYSVSSAGTSDDHSKALISGRRVQDAERPKRRGGGGEGRPRRQKSTGVISSSLG